MKISVKTILINIAIVAVLMLVIELVCRAVLPVIYARGFDAKMIEKNKYFDSPGLKENAAGKVWGKEYHVNSFGARKTAKVYDTKKKKWLFIGDSVTAGVGVDDSATFASLFSMKTDSFNLFDYSLIGYSTPDYWNVLKYYTERDTDIAKVNIFFCLNDVYGKAKSTDLPDIAKQSFTGWVNEVLQNKYATYKVLKLLVFRNTDNYFKYDLQFYNETDPHFTEAMAYLDKCDSLCKANNIAMQVVIIPYRSQIAGKDLQNRVPQNLVGQYCKSHQIAFKDATDYLQNEPNTYKLYLFADEIHFSERGHRAITDYLLSQ